MHVIVEAEIEQFVHLLVDCEQFVQVDAVISVVPVMELSQILVDVTERIFSV